MPVLPKDDTEGIRTRSQHQQEADQRRFGGAQLPTSEGQQAAMETTPSTSVSQQLQISRL